MLRKHLRYFSDGAFSSRHLNLLNLHIGLVNFGQILRLSVSAVFFLTLGMSLAATCLAMGALIGLRWVLRTPLILIPHRYGSKPALVIGQIMLALAFCLYGVIDHNGPLLWATLVLMAGGEALYWHAVHTTFATLSEHGKFGRQLAARGIFMSVGAILAHLATGSLQTNLGWAALFILTALTLFCSLLPLFFMPEPCPPKPMHWGKGFHISKKGMKLFGGWGAASAVLAVIWPIIIYQQFGSVSSFGYMMTATTLIGLLISIFIARRIDIGKGRGPAMIGALLYMLAVFLLALFGRDPLSIALLSALLSLASSAFSQPYSAALYQWAKETHDPLWFHYWSEFGWDLGNLAVLWSAALLLHLHPTLDLRWLMLAVFPACLWCLYIYVRYAPKPEIRPS